MGSEGSPEGRTPLLPTTLIQGLLGPGDQSPMLRPLCACDFHAWCVPEDVSLCRHLASPHVCALICPLTQHMLIEAA